MRRSTLPKRLPSPQTMDASEREYYRAILTYQKAYSKMITDGLAEVAGRFKAEASLGLPRADSYERMDVNIEKGIRELFESIQNRLTHMFPDALLRRWVQSMVGHVNSISKRNTTKVAKTVDLEIEPLMRDQKLTPYFQNVVDENVGLIRSIPEERMAIFKNSLVSAITQDKTARQIGEIIRKNLGSSKSKAQVIARDQVNKLNGKLNQYRQQQIGGERYIWRILDSRARDDHKRLNGKTFRWDAPPVVNRSTGARGHPGDDIQCRCYAEMVLDDIISQ